MLRGELGGIENRVPKKSVRFFGGKKFKIGPQEEQTPPGVKFGRIMKIDVYPLPDLVPANADPDAAVFIDVLRATSTMTVALTHGAERIIPVADAQEALRIKERMIAERPAMAGRILTGGERYGVKIAGFDLGNSPAEYTPEQVGGKTILFSTTNGTRAILSLKSGRTRKFLGSFLAADALVRYLADTESIQSVAIICAGTDRQYTEEDLLLAGLFTDSIAERLESAETNMDTVKKAGKIERNTVAETVHRQWRQFVRSLGDSVFDAALAEKLQQSRGGQNLVRVALAADIPDVARLNRFERIAEYRLGEIRLMK